MATPSNGLKNEKATFIVVICIMLFSLIYMSSYSLLMKNKIETFQQDMQIITREMSALMKYLPEKDSVIQLQKERIFEQMQDVQSEVARNQTSAEERERMKMRLSELKTQVEMLSLEAKDKVNVITVVQQPETKLAEPPRQVEKDPLIHLKEAEIARLKATIADLQTRQPSVIVQNKLAMYYFTVISSDKKNRASRTKNLQIHFQVKGNVTDLQDKYLYVEVRDPLHRIISSPTDKVKIMNHFVSEYNFEPFNYAFAKGKYSVKLYSEEAKFQSITFLTLN
jgi:hypothetical protein